ncbi:MAG: DMT family transporter [Caulobacteraceae bacterium]|nr:DMT family transporter [Caulobacteraceae bacterium]
MNLAQRVWSSGWLLLAVAMLFWAGNSVVGRAVNADIPPIALAFWRWAAAAVLIAPFAWPHLRRDWETLKRHRLMLAVLALLGMAGFNALLYTALHTTTAVNTVLLQSATPPLIFLCTFVLYREKPNLWQVLGLAVALAGVAAIVSYGEPWRLLALQLNAGDALMLIAVAGYAVYSALLRRTPPLHPLSFLAATCFLSVLVLAPVYAAEALSGAVMPVDGQSLATLAYVAVCPSIISYLCFNRGVELMGANRAGQFMNLTPLFGALLAVVFLHEALRPYHGVGLLLIAGGIVLSSRR